jgi:2,4-didehydro-3-deoxy-L-rhamnonate hydrolase
MRTLPIRFLYTFGAVLLGSQAALAAETTASLDTVEISDRSDALTFARARVNGTNQLISVTSYKDGTITGMVLTGAPDDPVTAFQVLGFEALDELTNAAGATINVSAAELLIPVELGPHHIAAGTNFPEHAEEATVEDGPFLFTKAVQPTSAYSNVSAGDGLLDYEVELCFVGFEPIDLANPPEHIGLFLCNDYTNRAALMRNIDPFDVASGKGFSTGKSAPGFMPVGDLFVIPRDRQAFVPSVELSLYMNGERRQHAFQRQAIWDFEELLVQIEQRRDVTWDYRGTPITLPLENGTIPLRTSILGGTPSGTIFKGEIPLTLYVRAAFQWIAGGWDKSIVHWVVEGVIANARESGEFLKAGDTVTIHSDGLGVIRNTIVE